MFDMHFLLWVVQMVKVLHVAEFTQVGSCPVTHLQCSGSPSPTYWKGVSLVSQLYLFVECLPLPKEEEMTENFCQKRVEDLVLSMTSNLIEFCYKHKCQYVQLKCSLSQCILVQEQYADQIIFHSVCYFSSPPHAHDVFCFYFNADQIFFSLNFYDVEF